MKRIVFTMAVGKKKFAECALGLGRSLKLIGDDTRRVVITDLTGYPWESSFDEVLPVQDPIDWIFFSKVSALERTDADQVLFVDADGLAFRRLAPIFDFCQGKGLVVCGRPISSGHWYGDVADHCKRHHIEAMPQFNGGLIYYERTAQCQEFIERIREFGHKAKELGFQRDDPLIPDEPCISLALARHEGGFLAPDEMDFSNSAMGLIGKLRLNVLQNRCDFVCRRYSVRYVRPFIFHASRYSDFLVYWRQLDRLRKLEEYEAKHGYGYMSPGHKLSRSLQKRILRARRRL